MATIVKTESGTWNRSSGKPAGPQLPRRFGPSVTLRTALAGPKMRWCAARTSSGQGRTASLWRMLSSGTSQR